MTMKLFLVGYIQQTVKIMSSKISTAKFVEKLKRINPNIAIIGEYTKAQEPIRAKCLVCGHEWDPTPNRLLVGKGCPNCAGNLRYTKKSFADSVLKINRDISIIGEYTGKRNRIDVKCDKCGHIWSPIGDSLLRGHGCPKCAGNNRSTERTKGKDLFIQQLSKINDTISLVSDYNGSARKSEFVCKLCGNKWSATPKNILHGTGCPNCASSFGERKVSIVLKSLGVSFIREHTFQDCRSTRVLPFDFYLPDYNACIEFDGIQHFEPVPHFGGDERFTERKRNDEIKTKYCDQKGIRLLRIPYFNICSVERDVTRFIEGIGGDLCE